MRVAKELAAARSIAILWAMGITQHTRASDGSTALSNLLLITGNYMRDEGGPIRCAAITMCREQAISARRRMCIPGYQSVTDPEIRKKFEAGWGVALPPERGMDNHEMVDAMHEGKLRAMYLCGRGYDLGRFQREPCGKRIREAGFLCGSGHLLELVYELRRLRTPVETASGRPLDLALTTNGHLLAELAQPLRDAGLNRVTVSMERWSLTHSLGSHA